MKGAKRKRDREERNDREGKWGGGIGGEEKEMREGEVR